MSVGRICCRVVYTATPEESAQAAAARMRDHGVGALVVVDAEGRPVAVVTDRDLALRIVAEGRDPGRVAVREVASAPAATVTEEASIESALGTMRARRVRRLAVVDAAGRLAGILALDDVLDLLAEELGSIGGLIARQAPR